MTRDADPDFAPVPSDVARAATDPMPSLVILDQAAQAGMRKKAAVAGIAAALILSVAAIGIPAGWYKKAAAPVSKPAPTLATQAQGDGTSATYKSGDQPVESAGSSSNAPGSASAANDAAAIAKREREAKERERQKAEERASAADKAPAASASAQPVAKPDPAKSTQKMVSVQVTYDENGRVTQTSGGDGMAQRIARQKRFPAGKAGSATVTIPIN